VRKISLETTDQVVNFLKILAEESVKEAQKSLESDPKQNSLEGTFKKDEQIYGSLDEQPDEDEGEEFEEEEVEEEEVEEEEGSMSEPEKLEVSLDSISSAVKDLRSGRSVDDSSMKEQLRTYFDKLDSTEREALLAFMKAFGGILTGQFQGSDAPDPSDEPWSISMSHSGEETGEEVEEEEEVSPEDLEGAAEEEEEEEEPAESPPIKAGARDQELQEIRKRVHSLMKL